MMLLFQCVLIEIDDDNDDGNWKVTASHAYILYMYSLWRMAMYAACLRLSISGHLRESNEWMDPIRCTSLYFALTCRSAGCISTSSINVPYRSIAAVRVMTAVPVDIIAISSATKTRIHDRRRHIIPAGMISLIIRRNTCR